MNSENDKKIAFNILNHTFNILQEQHKCLLELEQNTEYGLNNIYQGWIDKLEPLNNEISIKLIEIIDDIQQNNEELLNDSLVICDKLESELDE